MIVLNSILVPEGGNERREMTASQQGTASSKVDQVTLRTPRTSQASSESPPQGLHNESGLKKIVGRPKKIIQFNQFLH